MPTMTHGHSLHLEHKEFNGHYHGDISDNNPMCESDDQRASIEFGHTPGSRNHKGMKESRSFNNLLRNSSMQSLKKQEPALKQHLNEFNKLKSNQLSTQVKTSSKEYNSSIHQCKPTRAHEFGVSDLQLPPETRNYLDVDACGGTDSVSLSSKYTDIPKSTHFATYSNISVVPNHNDENYSSAEEIAVNLMSHQIKENKVFKQVNQGRYNESFGNNELRVDTGPNAFLLNDICDNPCTVKNNSKHNNMLREFKRMTSSRSTRNL